MLRNLVTGADSCAGGGGGGESAMANNPLGRLADAVLGAGSRGKEAARGVPGYLEGVGLVRCHRYCALFEGWMAVHDACWKILRVVLPHSVLFCRTE